jgi:hypothetical protein
VSTCSTKKSLQAETSGDSHGLPQLRDLLSTGAYQAPQAAATQVRGLGHVAPSGLYGFCCPRPHLSSRNCSLCLLTAVLPYPKGLPGSTCYFLATNSPPAHKSNPGSHGLLGTAHRHPCQEETRRFLNSGTLTVTKTERCLETTVFPQSQP